MSLFKRITTTLASRLDQLVGEIENHDAIIQASLNDIHKKVAVARVRLNQISNEQRQLTQQIHEQQENSQRWRKRAIESAKTDESKALECLNRSYDCEQKMKNLAAALTQYSSAIEKLTNDIETSEQHLSEMKQKRTLLRARQSSNAAMIANTDAMSGSDNMLEATFNRWEVSLAQAEMMHGQYESTDTLEINFLTQERQAELKKELELLIARESE